MLKYFIYSLIAIILIIAISSAIHLLKVNSKNKKEMAQYMLDEPVKYTNNLGKTLVIYYSLTNNTENIAKQIQEITKADIYKIETTEKINNTPWFYLTLRKQLKTKQYPEIKKDFPDFSKYDTIFVGSPVWWYTIATPTLSFLNQVDFKNKNVIPFSTQGSNYGKFFEDFKSQAKNANIKQGQSFNNLSNKYDNAVKNKIIMWLNSLEK